MRYLLAMGMLSLAGLQLASADESRPTQGSAAALCAQQGIARGYEGKDLEDFVARCVQARQSGGEGDAAVLEAASGC